MKKVNFFSASLAMALAVISFSFTTLIGPGPHQINTSESQVIWKAYKVTGEHAGNVAIKSGELEFNDAGALSGGRFVMDMTSIAVTDMEGEWAKKLEGHLKSPDFFGVENFPTATLVITNVVPKGTPGDYKITGNITIKETTKEIKFYANIAEENGLISAKAEIKIDRADFNVRYGSGSFFDNLGDKTVYDEFDLSVALVTKK